MGIIGEFLLPIGRWHGYGGETDTAGASFETLTWASALLAGTQEISIFCTVHMSLINPIFAAKQMVTADHVGEGRFGVNLVAGWNVGEHEMFGLEIREHDERYDYAEEWLTIVKRVWAENDNSNTAHVGLNGTAFKSSSSIETTWRIAG